MRRVRSSKCGQAARNFCVKMVNLFMRTQHTAMTVQLIPLFIYSSLVPDTVLFDLILEGPETNAQKFGSLLSMIRDFR